MKYKISFKNKYRISFGKSIDWYEVNDFNGAVTNTGWIKWQRIFKLFKLSLYKRVK